MNIVRSCLKCGQHVDNQDKFCPCCGGSEFITKSVENQPQAYQSGANQQIDLKLNERVQTYPPLMQTYQTSENISSDTVNNENIIAGIVGAFLFSLLGGFLYFVIYQIGVIAGICGLAIFILANFGYGLFAKTKNKSSMVGLIVSIIAMIVMIFLAEYFCISFEIFNVYKDQGITIFDAIRATPEFLAEPEIGEAVAGDLAFAYIFGFIASISNIVNIVKARKKK